jgi:hypothetical protein
MIKTVLAACALLCALTINAEARQRHKPTGLHPECNVTMPCIAPSASTPEQVRWARGMYISRQIGLGGPHVKRAVRAPKARQASIQLYQGKPSGLLIDRSPASPGGLIVKPAKAAIPSPSIAYTIAKPLRFIAGKLKCALNLNAALAEKGIAGTGSAMAHSFDRWGRASVAVPGAVAVTDRRGGGHVALVSRVEGGRVFVFNPGRRGWAEIEYTSRRARYRVAS